MIDQLVSTDELINGEETTVWRLDIGKGRIIININKSSNNHNDSITACEWPGEEHHFIEVHFQPNFTVRCAVFSLPALLIVIRAFDECLGADAF